VTHLMQQTHLLPALSPAQQCHCPLTGTTTTAAQAS